MNVASRGIRNAFRNMIRTFSIVVILGLSMGLALAMLVANKAVGQKIDSIQSSVGNTVSVNPAGARGFEGGGSALTESTIDGLSSVAHVSSIEKTVADRLTTSNTNLVSAVDVGSLGRRFAANSGQNTTFTPPAGFGGRGGGQGSLTTTFTPPVTVTGTTSPNDISTNGGGTFKLIAGSLFSDSTSDTVALLGKTLAAKNNLKLGSTFTAYGKTVIVTGIFNAGNAFSNNQVIMPLKTLQALSAQTGQLTAATIMVDSLINVDSVTKAVSSKLGSAADVTNGAEQAKTAIAPLQNIQMISLYSLLGAAVAGAVIILLTMIMIVRERRREIGVIKAIGASNVKVVGQFMAEAVTLTLLGAVVGMVVGVLAANPITKTLINNTTSNLATQTSVGGFGRGGGRGGIRALEGLNNISATVGWEIILYGLAAAIIIAVIGSTVAAFFIAKIRPAEVMRTE